MSVVYTKHFTIHTIKNLNQTIDYIENNHKTVLGKKDSSDSHMDNIFQYIFNENKTLGKQLVSGYGIIDPLNAAEEFIETKQLAEYSKGTNLNFDTKKQKIIFDRRSLEKNNAVLAHHLIQSFSPEDSLTPEEIHEIGRQTILELTGCNHEFVIATHVDKEHIHNHIIFNSTNLKTGKAFRWQRGTKRIYE